MPKRPSRKRKPRPDANQAALDAINALTGEAPPADGKNPAAVALGRLGGQKGGKARAAKLSKKRRADIARKAARARWWKRKP